MYICLIDPSLQAVPYCPTMYCIFALLGYLHPSKCCVKRCKCAQFGLNSALSSMQCVEFSVGSRRYSSDAQCTITQHSPTDANRLIPSEVTRHDSANAKPHHFFPSRREHTRISNARTAQGCQVPGTPTQSNRRPQTLWPNTQYANVNPET